eukprot:TRINITY_DN33747_c0_g1_i1.p1 TRINITY_DN33747_c0_g1~~TRINITY_DN33747_c0_g1_i1.p1  ORF type:complete len:600 (-),score=118.55 TRINITY_DN33747_c0_g1_i1:94-1893(-)
MGRKANNMPVSKKKIKNKANRQIQGKSGFGKRREVGRKATARIREKGIVKIDHGEDPEKATKKEPQKSYTALAKEQETKFQEAEKARAKEEATGGRRKKGKRKRRRDAANNVEAAEPESEVVDAPLGSNADIREGTVQFQEEEDFGGGGGDDANGSGSGSSCAATGLLLKSGSAVIVCGLQGACELNGRVGHCLKWDGAKSRWLVRLSPGGDKLLKSENIKLHCPLLRPEAIVRLVGLQSMPGLNGTTATCVSWHPARGRWLVRSEDGSERMLKPENLVVRVTKPSDLQLGCSVSLIGLNAAPELNFKLATCLRWDKGKQRWLVRTDGGMSKLLKLENLEVLGCQAVPQICPAVTQLVYVCEEEEDKLKRLVDLVHKMRQEEKAGVRPRALMLIFCRLAETAERIVGRLKDMQFGCSLVHANALKDKREYEEREFRLDRRRFLVVATDGAGSGSSGSALASAAVRRRENVDCLHHVVNLDAAPSFEEYRRRVGLLTAAARARVVEKNDETVLVDGFVYSFLTQQDGQASRELLTVLENSRAHIDPGLRNLVEVVAKKAAAAASGGAPADPDTSKHRQKRPRRRSKPEKPSSEAAAQVEP